MNYKNENNEATSAPMYMLENLFENTGNWENAL